MNCMVVALAAAVAANVFPVKPECRYRMAYDWEVVGGEMRDFALDPDGPGKVFNYRGAEYPAQLLYFSKEQGRDEHVESRNALVPGRSGRMEYEFYAPSYASFLRLQVNAPRGCKAVVSNVSLEEVKGAPELNVNPDFSLGLYNYSGVQGCNDGTMRLVKSPSGGTALFGGFYCHIAKTAVEPGRDYTLELVAQGHFKRRMDGYILFDGADGKTVFKASLPRISRKKTDDSGKLVYDFTVPPNAHWARLWLYHATVESVRILPKGGLGK